MQSQSDNQENYLEDNFTNVFGKFQPQSDSL